MNEETEFCLVDECDPIIWKSFLASVRPIFEQYAKDEHGLAQQDVLKDKALDTAL